MKLFIIGVVASGKTTLAKKLSGEYHIPWYEGDCIAHKDDETGRYKRTEAEQIAIIQQIDLQDSWIIEGTPRNSQKILLDLSDRIIFLDPPLPVRKRRIFFRYLKQKLGIEKSHYKPDLAMLKAMYRWTSEFEKGRTSFEEDLSRYGDKIIRIQYDHELEQKNLFS